MSLPVPFFSQVDANSAEHHNDCGAGSSKMVAGAYKLALSMTVDQIFNDMEPSGDLGLSEPAMQVWLAKQGLKGEWKGGLVLHDLYDFLVARKPVIMLIHYAPLVAAGLTQFTNFTRAHFVVARDANCDAVFINDPYRNNGTGIDQPIPINIMMQAWAECYLDEQNPPFTGFVPNLPIQDLSGPVLPSAVYVITYPGVNIRSGPSSVLYPKVVRTQWKGEKLQMKLIDGKLHVVNQYAELTDGNWVFADYISPV